MFHPGQAGLIWHLTHQTDRDRREVDDRLGRLAARWSRRRLFTRRLR
jgi:hypothetical protein